MSGVGALPTGGHVAVVGAGILGVAAALRLLADGRRVTLFDPKGVGEGASRGNASILAVESCVPIATPGILRRVPGMLLDPLGPLAIRWRYLPRLAPWLWHFVRSSRPAEVERISVALAALLDRALEDYAPLLRGAGAEDMIRRQGMLLLFESERRFAAMQPDLALQRRRGVRLELLPPEEIRQLEPAVAPIFRRAVFFPDNAHATDSHRLLLRLAEAAFRGGAALRREAVTGFAFANGGVSHVVTASGRHAVDAVVLAAGAWSKPLARLLGHRVLLDTERGYHVMLPEPHVAIGRPVYFADRGLVATPLEGGLRIAGTVELGGLALPPNPARAQVLLEQGRRMFPGLGASGRSDWMGFRPSMPDSLPVIAASPLRRNAVFAFGHGHLGLTLAAVTGRIVADLLAGRDPGLDLRPYRIDRF